MHSSLRGAQKPLVSDARTVVDASAIIALVRREPGHERTEAVLQAEERVLIGAPNFSEIVSWLADRGVGEDEIREVLLPIGLEVVPFDAEMAIRAGMLRAATRASGLGLGDQACLALALSLGARVLTTDRAWATLGLPLAIEVVR